MRSWTRTVRGIWRSGLRVEALALLSAAREERVRHPLGRFGRGEGLLDVKERGEQDARDRLSIFYRMPVSWRPARRFWTRSSVLVGGRVSETGPGLSELSALTQVRRAGLLPIRFQPHGSPAVVRGGRIRRRWSQYAGHPRIGLGLPGPGFA